PGYTLFAPLRSTQTYLIDMRGHVVHEWKSGSPPGHAVYLLPDGSLLRCEQARKKHSFQGGGIGGSVVRLAPDSTVLWRFDYAGDEHCLHHDIEPLPNGNILMIAWERRTRDEALAAGRDPDLQVADELWPDEIIEVEPTGSSGGRIVWRWRAWDHLVQELDPDKPNYGVVAEHPELIDLNFRSRAPRQTPEQLERLRALGYIGGGEDESEPDDEPRDNRGRGPGGGADWLHINSVAYNAELDQILLSVHNFSEIWIIDHSTTLEQASGHTGGRYGRGGDLLYRWGNPRAYGAGDAADQRLFAQHDARWIPAGSPGAGHILAFNNGIGRRDGQYSSVDEIAPPVAADGSYTLRFGAAFEPRRAVWTYVAADRGDFYSSHISGAQRLPNGDTLICSGEQGRLFEVDAGGRIVWEYHNPFGGDARPPHGPPPGAGPRPPFRGDRPPPPRGASRPPRRPPPGGVDGDRGPRPDERTAVFRALRYGLGDEGIRALLGETRANAGRGE
ncbi:MAG: hypothetical protein D6744_01755, partial [Planctomycetota bacterium]